QASRFVPWLAKIAAAADVRDREDDAAIEQAEPVRAERRIDADAVGTVAVEQHRRGPVSPEALAVDDGDRDVRAIGGLGVEALGLVLGRIVAAQHLLLFLQLA